MVKKKSDEKEFKSFKQMMKQLKGITFAEFEEMKLEKKYKLIEAEDIDGYAAIFACADSEVKIKQLMKDTGLHIITECIYDDGDEDEEGHQPSAYLYSTGFSHVNRERFYLCRSSASGTCEELED